MRARAQELFEELKGTWRFRWQGLWAAWVIAVLGWTGLILWPDMYEADTRIFVDTRTALEPVLQGLAVQQDVNGQLNYVGQSLLATPRLEAIATDTGLLTPQIKDEKVRLRIISRMRDRVSITVRSAASLPNERDPSGSVIGIAYFDRSRERALKVVDALLNTLVKETLGGKRQGSEDAQKFLETQIREYEQRLSAAEQRLADFKKKNVGSMPSQQGGYFERLQAEMDAQRTTENALAVAVSRRDAIRQQLRGESAVTAGGPGTASAAANDTTSKVGSDLLAHIAETQAKLDDLLLKFTDKHPDVIATRETLQELKQRREQEIEALRKGDPEAVAASGAAENPVYQSIQLALNQADVEIATLTRQGNEHRARVVELRKALDTMPQVEAEFVQLNRDYDVNKTQFTALLTQLERAKLGQQAETSGSVRFEIVEPTNAGYHPATPRRALTVALILMGAVAAGGALAYLRHKLTPVFWSSKVLAAFANARVLGVVSSAFPDAQQRANRRDLLWYSGAAAGLVLLAAVILRASQFGLLRLTGPLS
jgi:polysaccharide chain length determinant protein (PEP-CTERM system associated)